MIAKRPVGSAPSDVRKLGGRCWIFDMDVYLCIIIVLCHTMPPGEFQRIVEDATVMNYIIGKSIVPEINERKTHSGLNKRN